MKQQEKRADKEGEGPESGAELNPGARNHIKVSKGIVRSGREGMPSGQDCNQNVRGMWR